MKPPSQYGPDDLDEEYRRASALDPSRPSEAVRRTVLDHAAKLAAERTVKQGGIKSAKRRQPMATHARWRPAIFGSLAAAALAGILIAPHLLGPRVPPAPARDRAPPTVAARAERAPAAESGPGTVADQPRLAQADSSLKAGAGAARNSAAPRPREAGPVDPAAALRRAAEVGDTEELNALLGATHDVDVRDGAGRTALMLAVLHGQAGAVDVLLAHGADPNAADARGTSPLQLAVAGDQQAIIRALQRAGAR